MEYPQKQEVNKEKRLEIYKDALDIYQNNPKKLEGLGSGLCLLLPSLLWNLSSYMDDDPQRKSWDYDDTVILFPELRLFIESSPNIITEEKRIEFLKESIKALTTN